MPTTTLKNYIDLDINNTKKPENTHLIIETSLEYLYIVDSADNKEMYKSIDKGATWTRLYLRLEELTPAYGRLGNIFSLWHDRVNNLLYGFNIGSEVANFEVFCIDLTDDTYTEKGQINEAQPVGGDLFVIGVDLFAWWINVAEELYVDKWVDPNWVNQDSDLGANLNILGFTIVVGTKAYIVGDEAGDTRCQIFEYDNTIPAIDGVETIAGTSLPEINMRGASYDGNDLMYFVLNVDGDSKNYLYSYAITTDTLTKLGEYDIALMLDRNTASGVMEKAFHITELKIYEIQEHKVQLHFIAIVIAPGHKIIAITDNFLITDTA